MTPAPAKDLRKPYLAYAVDLGEPQLMVRPDGLPKQIVLTVDGEFIWSSSGTALGERGKVRIDLSVVRLTDAELERVPE